MQAQKANTNIADAQPVAIRRTDATLYDSVSHDATEAEGARAAAARGVAPAVVGTVQGSGKMTSPSATPTDRASPGSFKNTTKKKGKSVHTNAAAAVRRDAGRGAEKTKDLPRTSPPPPRIRSKKIWYVGYIRDETSDEELDNQSQNDAQDGVIVNGDPGPVPLGFFRARDKVLEVGAGRTQHTSIPCVDGEREEPCEGKMDSCPNWTHRRCIHCLERHFCSDECLLSDPICSPTGGPQCRPPDSKHYTTDPRHRVTGMSGARYFASAEDGHHQTVPSVPARNECGKCRRSLSRSEYRETRARNPSLRSMRCRHCWTREKTKTDEAVTSGPRITIQKDGQQQPVLLPTGPNALRREAATAPPQVEGCASTNLVAGAAKPWKRRKK